MKNRIIILLSTLAFCAASCQQEGLEDREEEAQVRVSFSLDHFTQTRSSSASGESEIKTLQLFAVDSGGDIVSEAFQEGGSPLSFRGRVGEKYHLYVFANNPTRIEGLETREDILKWEYRTDLTEHFSSGFPMAGEDDLEVSGRNCSKSIALTRLVSKLLLTLDKSDMDVHGTFSLNSVRLRNCPSALKPFQQKQKAAILTDVGDGDEAGAADLEKLNSGESVCFYILENMQGDLLPSNTDPWAKIPSSLGSAEGLCTYLEASGTYVSPGYNGSDSYRMYLGKDNLKNFDLCRNSLYRLTLSPTEDNMRMDGNWKITASDWSDTRSMYFSSSTVKVRPGYSQTVTLNFSPSAFDFTLSDDGFADAGLSCSASGSKITVSCSSSAVKGKDIKLYARSWDGRVEAACTVHIGEGDVWYNEVNITPYNSTIAVGETVQLKAVYHSKLYRDGELYHEYYKDVTTHYDSRWETSFFQKFVSVEKGLVTGLAVGEKGLISCSYLGASGSGALVTVVAAETGTETGTESE